MPFWLSLVIALIASLYAFVHYIPSMSFSEIVAQNIQNAVAGRRAIVVGGTAGIGKGCAVFCQLPLVQRSII